LIGGDTSIEVLETALDSLLNDAKVRLEKDARTASYANLKQTMTPLGWERKRRSIVDTACEFISNVRHIRNSTSSKLNDGFHFEDARGNGRWSEVPIYVPTLRLKGRIDLVERNANEIRIMDLKSGSTFDADGEIKPNIALQLLIYGVMAQTLDPGALIFLVINNGTEHPVPFDLETLEQTKEWLCSMVSSLVPGTIAYAEDYATVGPDCRWCGIRHRCERYLRDAPNLWTREMEWRLPMDTWGTLEALLPKSNGLNDLTLLDAGGRHVKVFNVRETHLKELSLRKKLWLFEVASSRPALRGNSWRHPLNFYEIDESDISNRAWSLQVFIG
jgi:hypothetical protein